MPLKLTEGIIDCTSITVNTKNGCTCIRFADIQLKFGALRAAHILSTNTWTQDKTRNCCRWYLFIQQMPGLHVSTFLSVGWFYSLCNAQLLLKGCVFFVRVFLWFRRIALTEGSSGSFQIIKMQRQVELFHSLVGQLYLWSQTYLNHLW